MGQISGHLAAISDSSLALGAKQNCSLREKHVIGFTAVATLADCGVAKYSSRLSPATSLPRGQTHLVAVVIAPRVNTTRLCVTPNTLAVYFSPYAPSYSPTNFHSIHRKAPAQRWNRRRRQLVQSLKLWLRSHYMYQLLTPL